jgi:RNA polymerase sigma-70 factor (ECF subfamily)
MASSDETGPTPEETGDLLATRELLPRARAGDREAREELFARFAPVLRRFLHARLPSHARGMSETQDLAQEVCAQALDSLDRFEYRGPGSFWCYLRRIGLNQVHLLARRLTPPTDEAVTYGRLGDEAPEVDPLGTLLGKELFAAFESAIESIPTVHRQAVLMRLELKLPYAAIAAECGYTSADAARMAVCRAMEKVVARLSSDGFHQA